MSYSKYNLSNLLRVCAGGGWLRTFTKLEDARQYAAQVIRYSNPNIGTVRIDSCDSFEGSWTTLEECGLPTGAGEA
jgi:hypothetical protein